MPFKKEDMVRVIYFKVDREPETGYMINTVDGMQKAIGGGYAQVINIGIKGMVVLCDEEGLMKQLPFNRGLRGDWLVVGVYREEFVSLTDKQIDWIKQNIKFIKHHENMLKY